MDERGDVRDRWITSVRFGATPLGEGGLEVQPRLDSDWTLAGPTRLILFGAGPTLAPNSQERSITMRIKPFFAASMLAAGVTAAGLLPSVASASGVSPSAMGHNQPTRAPSSKPTVRERVVRFRS
jgi:hypothetical protein